MKKKMILVAAPPACGKTYVSELIAKSIDHIVYLDKDDLGDLIRAAFSVCGEKVNMDGDFYINNLRSAEYSTMMDIAFSALRFENIVLVFFKQVLYNSHTDSSLGTILSLNKTRTAIIK